MVQRLSRLIVVLALAVPGFTGMAGAHASMSSASAHSGAHMMDQNDAVLATDGHVHAGDMYPLGEIDQHCTTSKGVADKDHCCDNRAGHCGTTAFLVGNRFRPKVFLPERIRGHSVTVSLLGLNADTDTPPPKA